jgi:hypothetical protein
MAVIIFANCLEQKAWDITILVHEKEDDVQHKTKIRLDPNVRGFFKMYKPLVVLERNAVPQSE